MAVFFTSDTHFGHESIIRHCERPFASAEEMDEALIAGWNDVVGANDTVYHLGDFSFRNRRARTDYRRVLNGTIHLVVGNHDHPLGDADARHFASVSPMTEIKLNRQRIVLCHFPLREWHQCKRGSWHLFGHMHGRLDHAPLGYSLDVGVDSHDFRPWSFEEIAAIFETRDNPFREK